MNRIILIGNLVADPEARTTQSGISQSTFRIAVQRRFANQQGVRESDFFTVIAWRQTAEFVNHYLTKGSKVAVEGSVQVRSYDAQDGSKRYITEVIADSVESLTSRKETEKPADAPNVAPKDDRFIEVDDDGLPWEK